MDKNEKKSFFTTNKKLAVKPILNIGPKATFIGGVALVDQGVNTATTDLLFDAMLDDEVVLKGTKIVFLGSAEMKAWNKTIFRHDGVEFVLAPMEDVVMISS